MVLESVREPSKAELLKNSVEVRIKGTGKEDQGKRKRRFHEIAWVILFPCHSTLPGIITRRHVVPPLGGLAAVLA